MSDLLIFAAVFAWLIYLAIARTIYDAMRREFARDGLDERLGIAISVALCAIVASCWLIFAILAWHDLRREQQAASR